MGLLQLFEPEETVGNIWHDLANRIDAEAFHPEAAITFADVRPSLAMLFRALGGAGSVDIGEAPPIKRRHRTLLRRRLTRGVERIARPSFDGERLRLPAVIGCHEDPQLNRASYLWLTAAAALVTPDTTDLPAPDAPATCQDAAYIRLNRSAADAIHEHCPGLARHLPALAAAALTARAGLGGGSLEQAVRDSLAGRPEGPSADSIAGGSGDTRIAPVAFWMDFQRSPGFGAAPDMREQAEGPAPAAAYSKRKLGDRRDLDQADRTDSLIVHRFESILSWVESMNINRSVDDDDDENAEKAADDQDSITLSKHHKRAATRLRFHLDLSPAEAEHERLAAKATYPEWNCRTQAYMPDHCRVLEAEAGPGLAAGFMVDGGRADQVRKQFETLRPRRILLPRQRDGSELDLDALIAARADLAATGRGSDRIYLASRQIDRDLSVALLVDTSRSTESDMGGTCVIDVARDALSALAHGLDACGDRFGIWGFSSLKRNRVFVTRCKGFDEKMSAAIDRNIAALKPGQYTRLGAAIRHTAAQLVEETSARRLLLILTDGKPNDLDHYEGRHGIEDSRMAVREARRAGLAVHSVIIDEDGQDWFARIFGKGGFTLLPRPERLITALPDIYRTVTQEA